MFKEDLTEHKALARAQGRDLSILSIAEATVRGLVPLTVADSLDKPLCIGDGTCSLRYVEWLVRERQRITQHGDRQAEIVDEGKGQVSLWVDDVTRC
jgi:hypothetical protein